MKNQFTELYKTPKEINPTDKYVIIETSNDLEVQENNLKNIKVAIVSSNDIDMVEVKRNYYAEKYRCFYAKRELPFSKGEVQALENEFQSFNTRELFNYLIDLKIISEEEFFGNWENDRDTMIDYCKYHK